jgi:hypothetical protein
MPSRQIPVKSNPVTCVCSGKVILEAAALKVITTRRPKPSRETPIYPIESVSGEGMDGFFKIVSFEDGLTKYLEGLPLRVFTDVGFSHSSCTTTRGTSLSS